jgi:hypothetical protein
VDSVFAKPMVVKKGMLLKQSQHWKSWNDRYFELHPTCLRYFVSPADAHAKQEFDLRMAHVSGISAVGRPPLRPTSYRFRVTVACGNSTKVISLASLDAVNANDWVVAIGRSISNYTATGAGLDLPPPPAVGTDASRAGSLLQLTVVWTIVRKPFLQRFFLGVVNLSFKTFELLDHVSCFAPVLRF